jgi:hypothetical protein
MTKSQNYSFEFLTTFMAISASAPFHTQTRRRLIALYCMYHLLLLPFTSLPKIKMFPDKKESPDKKVPGSLTS